MKTLRSFSILLTAIIIGTGTAYAGSSLSEEAEAAVNKVGIVSNSAQDRVVVVFENNAELPFTVAIHDAEGNTLHSETVSHSGVFNKRYDLGELENGEYTVTVANKSFGIESSEKVYKNQ